ncbi:hypothetical protein NDU88_004068 [Pleurodeles waltl]|uniref:Uncharacterized protein n=1 Tax=Pleurodeles waltl TaxID=8319 RepID=A0AAV7T757_PLEWA|nr:hypothetical protein NDU88_004068 [Pleurodeles waltl]
MLDKDPTGPKGSEVERAVADMNPAVAAPGTRVAGGRDLRAPPSLGDDGPGGAGSPVSEEVEPCLTAAQQAQRRSGIAGSARVQGGLRAPPPDVGLRQSP